jgi:hypothetical protein
MKPVNTKSLFSTLCLTLEKLDSAEVDVATANSISKLVGQCANLLNYELKRAVILSNPDYEKNHRNLEEKKFDSIPN